MKISTKIKRILRGMAKSWTANYSLFIIILGGLEQYRSTLTDIVGAKWTGIAIMVGGLLGLILRFKTKESLEDKGIK